MLRATTVFEGKSGVSERTERVSLASMLHKNVDRGRKGSIKNSHV
jgi:hypothetical protein